MKQEAHCEKETVGSRKLVLTIFFSGREADDRGGHNE